MKKLLLCLLTLGLGLTLTGCFGKGEEIAREDFVKQLSEAFLKTTKIKSVTVESKTELDYSISGKITYSDGLTTTIKESSDTAIDISMGYTEDTYHFKYKSVISNENKDGEISSKESNTNLYETYVKKGDDGTDVYSYGGFGLFSSNSINCWEYTNYPKSVIQDDSFDDILFENGFINEDIFGFAGSVDDYEGVIFYKSGNTYTVDYTDQSKLDLDGILDGEHYGLEPTIDNIVLKLNKDGLIVSMQAGYSVKGTVSANSFISGIYNPDENQLKQLDEIGATGSLKIKGNFTTSIKFNNYDSTSVKIPSEILALKKED